MFAVQRTRAQPPIGVLLGGSGLARLLPVTVPRVSALFKPVCGALGPAQRP